MSPTDVCSHNVEIWVGKRDFRRVKDSKSKKKKTNKNEYFIQYYVLNTNLGLDKVLFVK